MFLKNKSEEIKYYYREIENYDWTHITDNFVGLETFFHRYRLKKIKYLIDKYNFREGKCLDLGCGTGLITRYLPKDSIGMDINPRNLEKAKKYAPYINFIEGDIEQTPFKNEMFDNIICTEVIEHLFEPQKTIFEIKRILKPNGLLIGSVPTNGLIWKLRFLSRTCGAKEHYHKHYYKKEIKELLQKNFSKTIFIDDILRMNWFFVCRK